MDTTAPREAVSVLLGNAVGPRGGDAAGTYQAEARKTAYNGTETHLHVFEDVARPGIQDEKPWHYMAAVMMLAGKKNTEIAAAANVEPQSISVLRSQRWFQEKLAVMAKQQGEEVLAVCRAEALASVNVLVELRDSSPEAKPSVARDRLRMDAATRIVEIGHGKPTQRVVSVSAHTNFASPQEEMDDVMEHLASIRAIQASSVNPT